VNQPDHFSTTFKMPTGDTVKTEEPATGFTDLDKFVGANPVNAALLKIYGPRSKLNQAKPRRLEIFKKRDAALMTMRTFGIGKNADEAASKMQDFLEKSFEEIRKNKINNLIIDLRYNPGGWDNTGQVLITYLIGTPSYYYRRFHTVTDSSAFLQLSSVSKEELKNIKNELIPEKDGTFTVKEEYNKTLAIQLPQKNRFTGKVYFIVNGGSGSSAGEFSAVAYSNHLGVFVGEETQGNYTGDNGGEFIPLVLPLTKIFVNIPLLYYDNAVTPPARVGRGTIPEYIIPNNMNDILSGTDTQLNFVFDLIGKNTHSNN
ncbi:MAG TPA: S41 family peptidase, partial [Puia sp.]|nr:S41 family peptidase [Puia sp.]